MFTILKNKTYRNLFLAQVIAHGGTGLVTIALALLAYDIAGQNAGQVLGIALALKMVAYVIIAPIVGAMTHRFNRKTLLIVLDVFRAALFLFMPFITEAWHIYVFIFAINAAAAGFTPTFQALIPDVLTDEADYTKGLALASATYDLENLLSPVAAAAALMFFSFHGLFYFTAVTYLISAALVFMTLVPKARAKTREDTVLKEITFGIRTYFKRPALRGLMGLNTAVAAAGAIVYVNTVIYVREALGAGEAATAMAFAAFGIGSISVAMVLPRFLETRPLRALMSAGPLLLCIGLAVALGPRSWTSLIIAWGLMGAGSSFVQIPAGLLIRQSCSEAERPALFSAQFALSHLCWLFAYPAAGFLGAQISLQMSMAVMLLVVAIAGASALALWPKETTLEAPGD
jgi:MFS family permease